LFAQLTGQQQFELFPLSQTKLFSQLVLVTFTFIKENGLINEVIFSQIGQATTLQKIEVD